jgi:sec-independent protein translocase protein TatB
MEVGMELLFLAVLALLVFGPRRLPEIARTVAKVMAELRKASNEFRYSLEDEIRNLEVHEQQQKRLEAQAALDAKPTAAVEGTVPRVHESNGPA